MLNVVSVNKFMGGGRIIGIINICWNCIDN